MSLAQIEKAAQRGGNLFSAVLGLARPLIKPSLSALAKAGLSFGAENVLKKIFWTGYGPREIDLYRLVQAMPPAKKRTVENALVGQGMVRGSRAAQYGGFLGMLSSIGVPLAISLVSKLFGKGLQVKAPRPDHGGSNFPPRERNADAPLPFTDLGATLKKCPKVQGRSALQF